MSTGHRSQSDAPPAPATSRAIVVVNFGSHSLVAKSLSALDLPSLRARIVIVDNAYSSTERAAITGLCATHGWTLSALGSNTGFGHAANVGVAKAAELGCLTYVLLNPDVRADTEALRRLFQSVEAAPMTMVCPRVLRPDGSVWFSGARVDVRAGRTSSAARVSADPNGWLTGACLAVHADLWSATGGFDPTYFLYWEDVDLSWRAGRVGGTLTTLDDVEVVHAVGGSQGGGRAKSPVYVYYNCRNRLLFAARNLDRAEKQRWLQATPRYAREILLRGGRRALARRPAALTFAAVHGSVTGILYAVRSLAPRTRHRRVRVYETVRSAHLERALAQVPASIIYGRRRYDFDSAIAEGLDLIPAGLAGTAVTLWRSELAAVEVNEPLMVSGLRRAATTIATVRLRHPVTPPLVVSYAIENARPHPAPSRGAKARVRGSLDRILAAYIWRRLDRVAFGTEAARDLYSRELPGAGPHLRTALVPALPQPCSCGRLDGKDPAQVLFVGALADRKGLPLLLDSWPRVVKRHPGARLLVVGKGRLEQLARDHASAGGSVALVVDPSREQVHRHLRTATVLVLPSRPAPGWREQVGLPIVEGLSHGCSVITTAETGLAGWLVAHGHQVVTEPVTAASLADAIAEALATARPAASVLADLPREDGRVVADRWLFAGTASSDAGGPE